MQQIMNANLLAQIAKSEIEKDEVLAIIGREINNAAINDEAFTPLDKLRVANSLKVVTSAAEEDLRPLAKAQFQELYGEDYIGTGTFRNGAFRQYETLTYTWENVRMPELTEEQKQKMTKDEIEKYETARETLAARNALFKRIKDIEAELAPLKPQLKGLNESLAAMLPTSKAIHRKIVFQVL